MVNRVIKRSAILFVAVLATIGSGWGNPAWAAFITSGNSQWTTTGNGIYYNGGNVGIGTTNPLSKLHVQGNLSLYAPTEDSQVYQYFYTHSVSGVPTPAAYITALGNHPSSNNFLKFYTQGPAWVMKERFSIGGDTNGFIFRDSSESPIVNILNGGNVGIGVTNPGTKLEVVKNQTGGTAIKVSNTNNEVTDYAEYQIGNTYGQLGGLRLLSGAGGQTGGFGAGLDLTIYNKYSGASLGGITFSTHNGASQGERMRINKVGNVGIGVINPGTKLEFVAATGNQINVAGGQVAGLNSTPVNTDHAVPLGYLQANYTPSGTAPGGVGSGTSGQTLRHDGTSWVGNSVLFNNGANIGIGTTGTAAKLDVVSAGGYSIKVNQLITMLAGQGLDWASGNARILESSYGLLFQTYTGSALTEKMRILGNGNVGIGTTNPAQKLSVAGATNSNPTISIDSTVNATNTPIGTLAFRNTSNSQITGSIEFKSHPTSSNPWDYSSIFFNTWNSYNTLSPKMVIQYDGNVGIGVTNPSALLDVRDGHLYVGSETFANPGSWASTINLDGSSHARILIEERSTGVQTALWAHTGGSAKVGTVSSHNFGIISGGAERMTFTTGGNVGIGTTVADTKLTFVAGAGNQINVAGGQVAGLNSTPVNTDHAVPLGYLQANYTPSGTAPGGVGSGTSGQTLRHDGTSWVGNSVLFNNGTNVGIGTANPEAKLDVNGTLKVRGGAIFGEPEISFGNLYILDYSAGGTYYSFGGDPESNYYGLFISDGDSRRIARFSNTVISFQKGVVIGDNYFYETPLANGLMVEGSVGIGTTNPAAKFSIEKTTALSGTVTTPDFQDLYLNDDSEVAGEGPTLVFSSDYNSGANKTVRAAIRGGTEAAGANAAGFLAFYTNIPSPANSAPERMRINSSGNVGIGTTTPGYKLHVIGDVNIPDGYYYRSNTNRILGQESSQVKFGFISGSINTYFGVDTSKNLRLVSSGSEFLTLLNTSGNVGIGTTAPGTKLTLSAATGNQINVSGGHVAGLNSTPVNSDHAVPLGYLQANYGPTSSSLWKGTLNGNIWNGDAGAGNVGIGTTAPGHKLQTVGNGLFTTNSASTGFQAIGGASTDGQIYFDTLALGNRTLVVTPISSPLNGFRFTSSNTNSVGSGGFVFSNGSTDNVAITSTGNVGIGTTVPRSLLDVYGASPRLTLAHNVINAGTVGIDFMLNADATAEKKTAIVVTPVGSYSRGNMSFVLDSEADSGNYDYAADTKLFIKNDGSVGIGTTNPSDKLDVAGAIKLSSNISWVAGNLPRMYKDAAHGLVLKGGTGSTGDFGITTNGGNWLFYNPTGTNNVALVKDTGNVGIGTTAPNAALDVYNGSIANRSASLNHYRNVLMTYLGHSNQTGTLKIVLPKQGDTMIDVTIKGFNYSSIGAWEARVSGYTYLGTGGWSTSIHKAQIIGSAPFSQIRLAYDGSKPVILLGNTSTIWAYGSVEVTDVTTSYSSFTDWGTGWSASLVTNETGLTTIATPTIYTYTNSVGNVGIGTTTPGTRLTFVADTNSQINVAGGQVAGLNSTPVNSDHAVPLGYLQANYGPTSSSLWKGTLNGNIWNGDAGAGNVGIGTTNPVTTLSVIKNSSSWQAPMKSELNLDATSYSKNYDLLGLYANVYLGLNSVVDTANSGAVIGGRSDVHIAGTGVNTFNSSIIGYKTIITTWDNNLDTKPVLNNVIGFLAEGTIGSQSSSIVNYSGFRTNTTGPNAPYHASNWGNITNYYSFYSEAKPTWATNYFHFYGEGNSPAYFGGNVGIGTTTPGYKLDVRGAILSLTDGPFKSIPSGWTGGLISEGGYPGVLMIQNDVNDKNYFVGVHPFGFAIQSFLDDGTQVNRFAIQDTTGNVGIGTTAPGDKLTINGPAGNTINVSGGQVAGLNSTPTNSDHAVPLGYLQANYSPTSGSLWKGTLNGSIWNGDAGAGNVGIGTTNPTRALSVKGVIGANDAGNIERIYINPTSSGTDFALKDASGNLTNGIRFDGRTNANSYFNTGGNVGIGTTAPDSKLHVSGSAKVTNVLRTGNYRHVLSAGFTSTAVNGYLLNTTIPYDGIINRGMHTIRIQGFAYGTNEPIDFVVNFYLYSSGFSTYNWTNYGAYDPGDVKLSYEGNFLKLWWSNVVYYPSFEVFTTSWIGASDVDSYFESWTITDAAAPTTNIVNVGYANAKPQGLTMGGNITLNGNWLSGDGGGEGIYINSSGNVGIGTATIGTKLTFVAAPGDQINVAGGHVAGLNSIPLNSDHAVPLGYLQANYTPGPGIPNGVGTGTSGQTLRHDGTSWVGNSVLFNNGANVGIGTALPTVKLQVNRDNSIEGLGIRSNSYGNGYVTGIVFNVEPNVLPNGNYWKSAIYHKREDGGSGDYGRGSLNFAVDSNNDAATITTADTKMTILSSGNVGIGTTAPTQQLDITKSINLVNTSDSTTGVIYKNGVRFLHNYGVAGTGGANGENIFIGPNSGNFTMTGTQAWHASANTAVGINTLKSITTSWRNTAMGAYALQLNIGNSNSAVGVFALGSNTTGYWNTAVGDQALALNIGGFRNTAVGMQALNSNLTGNYNTSIGYYSLFNALGSSNVAIGQYAGAYETGSNSFYVDNQNRTNTAGDKSGALLYGTFNANPLLQVLTINGNVGIGTTAPASKLHIYGVSGDAVNVGGGQVAYLNSIPLRSDHAIPLGFATSTFFMHEGNRFGTTAVVGTNDNYALQFETNNVKHVTITNNGNVGLGITNPSYKTEIQRVETVNRTTYNDILSVTANATVNPYSGHGGGIVFRGTTYRSGSGNVNYARIGSTLNDYSASTAGSDLFFDVSPLDDGVLSRAMTIKYNGNVGIGTATPGTKLTFGAYTENQINVAGGQVAGLNSTPINSDHAVPLGYLQANYSPNASSLWKGTLNGKIWNGDAGAGNVGIGITNPSRKLDIVNTSAGATVSQLAVSNLSGTLNTGASIDYQLDTGWYPTSLVATRIGSGESTFSVQTYSTVGGKSSKLFVDTTGNLGIGTTAPIDYKLEINAGASTGAPAEALRLLTTSTVQQSGVKIDFATGLDGASNLGYIIANRNSSLAPRLIFGVDGADKMIINNSGYVGIGTSSPQYKLDVYGNANFTNSVKITPTSVTNGVEYTQLLLGKFVDSTTGSFYLTTMDNGGSGSFINLGNRWGNNWIYRSSDIAGVRDVAKWTHVNAAGNNLTIYDYNGTTSNIYLNSNGNSYFNGGNVGIGTTNPLNKLHIYGISGDAVNVGGGQVAYLNSIPLRPDHAIPLGFATSTFFMHEGNNFGATAVLGTNDNYALQFETNNVKHVTITNNGNVGIGTTAPGNYRLKVSGNMVVTGTLETQTGSDFAEEFLTSTPLEPGMVVVMGNLGYKSVKAGNKDYDKTVVGIVSDSPSIIAGRIETKEGEHKAIVAMAGVVTVKASAANGPIKKGDLLTSSSLSGHAMKTDGSRPGTVIGKALEDLVGKKGEIKVLINLQ